MEEKIERWASMLNGGYGKDQIKDEIWSECLSIYHVAFRLEAIITLAMEIYGEVVRRSLK